MGAIEVSGPCRYQVVYLAYKLVDAKGFGDHIITAQVLVVDTFMEISR